jgi:hypothetical protein
VVREKNSEPYDEASQALEKKNLNHTTTRRKVHDENGSGHDKT